MTYTMTSSDAATERQLNYLRTLCEERGLDLTACTRPYGTKREASALIEYVLTIPRLPAQRDEQPRPQAAAPRAPRAVQVTETGIFYRGGEVYRVKRAQGSKNLYALRLKVIGGMRQTEAGAVVSFEFEYDKGAIFDLTEADRMTVEQAKELSLRYGVCINCSAPLKDAASVELGIGPVCIKKFVGGAEALKAARAKARAAAKAAPAPAGISRLAPAAVTAGVPDDDKCAWCGKPGCDLRGECTDGEFMPGTEAAF